MRSHAYLLVRALAIVDVMLLAGCFARTLPASYARPFPEFLLALLVVPFWCGLYHYFGWYESHRVEGIRGLAGKILTAQTAGFVSTAFCFWVVGSEGHLADLARFAALSTAAMLASKGMLYGSLRLLRRRGLDHRQVCVIGSWEKAQELSEEFTGNPAWGMQVAWVGMGLQAQREYVSFADHDRRMECSLEELVRREVIDEVVLAVRPEQLLAEEPVLRLCHHYGINGRIMLQTGETVSALHLAPCYGEAGVGLSSPRPDDAAMWLKRGMDIVLASFSLLLLSPVLLLVAVLVKLSSPGPAFFRQMRVGLNGRRFRMVKFRTMIQGAESMLKTVAHHNITGGPVFKDPNDWRVTEIGRVLRRFSLDELPQLWNVLRGDMSLVGPRPLPVHESEAIEGPYRRRFSVRPGITCIWQVRGRSNVEFEKWMNLDLEYVDNWSIWMDAKLLVQTIPAVLGGRGAY